MKRDFRRTKMVIIDTFIDVKACFMYHYRLVRPGALNLTAREPTETRQHNSRPGLRGMSYT